MISEKTKREQVAGKRARIRWCMRSGMQPMEIWSQCGGLCYFVGIEEDKVTVRLTSKLTGQSVLITEDIFDFPSEALVTQCRIVAG